MPLSDVLRGFFPSAWISDSFSPFNIAENLRVRRKNRSSEEADKGTGGKGTVTQLSGRLCYWEWRGTSQSQARHRTLAGSEVGLTRTRTGARAMAALARSLGLGSGTPPLPWPAPTTLGSWSLETSVSTVVVGGRTSDPRSLTACGSIQCSRVPQAQWTETQFLRHTWPQGRPSIQNGSLSRGAQPGCLQGQETCWRGVSLGPCGWGSGSGVQLSSWPPAWEAWVTGTQSTQGGSATGRSLD